DQKVDDVEINFIGSSTCDQKKEEANSDLKSMHNNEIMSIFGDDNEEADSDHELSTANEKVVDLILKELLNEENKEDTNVSTATTNEVSSKSVPYSVSSSSPVDIQALIAKAIRKKKNIPTVKIPNVQTLGAIRMDFLATYVHNLGLSLLDKLDDKMDSVVPRMSQRFVILEKKMRKFIRKTIGTSVKKNVHNKIGEINGLLREILVVNAKRLQTKVYITSTKLHKMVGLVSQLVRIVDSVELSGNAATEGEKDSQA
ncbi:hypothetical protein Tco_0783553, partial [Tanacetum coccineum]